MKKIYYLAIPLLMLTACGKAKTVDNDITCTGYLYPAVDDDLTEVSFKYNDDYFKNSSYKYSIKRLQASYVLSTSCVQVNRTDKPKDYYIKDVYNQLGFSNFYANDFFYSGSDFDGIAYTIASKDLVFDNTEYTLINLSVRGFSYYKEWISNGELGESGQHTGFNSAKLEVLDGLMNYIDTYNLENKNLKIWLDGYSRGGAVCNLVSKELDSYSYKLENNELYTNDSYEYNFDKELKLKTSDIFACTFEAPNVDDKANTDIIKPLVSNIFNAYNPDDLIFMLPPFEMSKYGINKNITLNVSQKKFKDDLLNEFSISKTDFKGNKTSKMFYNSFMTIFNQGGVTDRKTYVEKIETPLNYIVNLYSNSSSEQVNTFTSYVSNYIKENVKSTNEAYQLLGDFIDGNITIYDLIKPAFDDAKIDYNEEELQSISNILNEFLVDALKYEKKFYYTDILSIYLNYEAIIENHYASVNYTYIMLYKG